MVTRIADVQGNDGKGRGNHFDNEAAIRSLQMNGELTGEQATTFTTKVGVIRDRNVYFIYENHHGESGIIRGLVPSDTPKALTLVYTDLSGHDSNDDPSGTLVLTKRQ